MKIHNTTQAQGREFSISKKIRWGILLVVVAFSGSLAAGFEVREAGAAAKAQPESPVTEYQLEELEKKMQALEVMLGADGHEVDLLKPATIRERYEDLRRSIEAVAADANSSLAGVPTISPVHSGRISSAYTPTRFHPIHKRVQAHFGLDIAAPQGAPILAAADGVVTEVANTPSYGHATDIEHENGFITRYAHAYKILVRKGDRVTRGQVIGLVGQTGTATGPHLHYEIFKDGWSLDPINYLLDGKIKVDVQ